MGLTSLTLYRSALRNQQNSPLLRLPAELRNSIYEYALGGHIIRVKQEISQGRVIRFLPDFEVFQPASTSRLKHRSINMTALLQLSSVSRQLRAETKGLPYSLNAFSISRSSAENFVNTIPAFVRDAIKVLRMTYSFFIPRGD
jgi:hypothetical protein